MQYRKSSALVALSLTAALALAGCVNNASPAVPSSAPTAAASTDAAAVALLPDKVKSAGKLVIGTDPTYAPNEFKDASGKPIGWEIELMDAVAGKLGLTTEYQAAKFDNIIPGITGGKYDAGLSSFFDTKKREQVVDMVNYYTAGIQWAAATGKTVDPANACGLTVAAQNGTTEILDDLPIKNKACTDAGKPAIKVLGYDTQDDATNAVILGRAQAMTADAPVTNYAIKMMSGKLEPAGAEYDKFLYGIPVAKTSGTLKEALQKALQDLLTDGTYAGIVEKWGVKSGVIDQITINGAQS